jgi:hypothetical protein
MPTLAQIERAIFDVEGFRVAFRRQSESTGQMRDARGDMRRLPPYDFDKRFADDRTVNDWATIRIASRYGEYGLVPVVLYEDGSNAQGNTLVRSVRHSYPRRRR